MGVVRPAAAGRGGRLSNTWLTYPRDGDNTGKGRPRPIYKSPLAWYGRNTMINDYYLAGIIDGEASFVIVFKKDKRYRTGIHVITRFTLPQKNKQLLEEIKRYLGMGRIYWHSRDRLWYFEITSYRELYELTTRICPKLILKRNKCLKMHKILEYILSGKHLTRDGLFKIMKVWAAPETGANPR